jgi:hypothetical protein
VTDSVDEGTKGARTAGTRDFGEGAPLVGPAIRPPKKQIVAIGIDQYRSWSRLHNAVNDARGAVEAFKRHGFEEFRPALIDDAATHDALQGLVCDDLRTLGSEDSLVLFFAGHGHSITHTFEKGTSTKQGYLIPFNAEAPSGKTTTWINLKGWLDAVSKLPARHILVILDACHSGIALDEVFRWRSAAPIVSEPLAELRKRRSRRILTSALDHQQALDSGPRPGHSLFTGCLIEGLTGSLQRHAELPVITGSQLGLFVQGRVESYSSSRKQTPDFGALDLDDRGELVIDLPLKTQAGASHSPLLPVSPRGAHELGPKNTPSPQAETVVPPQPTGADSLLPKRPSQPGISGPPAQIVDGAEGLRSRRTTTPPPGVATAVIADKPPVGPTPRKPTGEIPTLSEKPVKVTTPTLPQPAPRLPDVPAPLVAKGLDTTFIAKLDLHDRTRARERVLSVVAADALTSLAGWATWSARHGWLTVVSEEAELESVIGDVLDQVPWMRLLPAARSRFAATLGKDEAVVDAELDKRTSAERETWIEDIAGREQLARIAGWLLASYREPWATGPDLTTAPAKNLDLLSALAALHAPISILLHHQAPSAAWLQQAIQTAVQLIAHLPHHAVAIGAPRALLAQVMQDRQPSSALALARKGIVPLELAAPPSRPTDSAAKATAASTLSRALTARHPALADLFAAGAPIKTSYSEHPVVVDLYAADAQLAIQIDDWYRTPDRQSYHRDRKPDRWVQRAGIFVTRFLAEDVETRLERVVEEIALGVATRRAADSSAEKTP